MAKWSGPREPPEDLELVEHQLDFGNHQAQGQGGQRDLGPPGLGAPVAAHALPGTSLVEGAAAERQNNHIRLQKTSFW